MSRCFASPSSNVWQPTVCLHPLPIVHCLKPVGLDRTANILNTTIKNSCLINSPLHHLLSLDIQTGCLPVLGLQAKTATHHLHHLLMPTPVSTSIPKQRQGAIMMMNQPMLNLVVVGNTARPMHQMPARQWILCLRTQDYLISTASPLGMEEAGGAGIRETLAPSASNFLPLC